MGKLELDRVNSVNKKTQVEMKSKTMRDNKTKCVLTHPQEADRQHNHRCDSLQCHHEKVERRRHGRSPSLRNIDSANSILEEEYNRMFLRHQENDAIAMRKHNSDISDFVTIMTKEDNLQSMRDDAVPSDANDSRRLRASESDLKSILSGTCKEMLCGNRPRDYTEPTLHIEDCGVDCTYNHVKAVLAQDMKGWVEQCACTSRKKCDSIIMKSSPWERANDVFNCDRACSNKQKSQRGWKEKRNSTQGTSCCCQDDGKDSLDRHGSDRKVDAITSPKPSCTPCSKCCSGSKVQVYQGSDTRTAVRSMSGAGQGCAPNICPPCQLCQHGCAALKLSPSEEKIALERDMARCDCKHKLLKLRLMKAFNVCAKCRLPRTLCRCLEDIIRDCRRREVEKEIELKQKAEQNGGAECTCEGDDPFTKLIHEVTNTCPKCGHWRTECTCLEEMISDVKRIMLKKKRNNSANGNGMSCKCLNQGKRGSRQNSMYQTTNVGNVTCSKCEEISFVVDAPLLEEDMNMRNCPSKDQNEYYSSTTYLNMQISKITSPLQLAPSSQVQLSNELEDMKAICDICSVCKKRASSCNCNVLDSVIVGECEQIRSDSQGRKRTERGTTAKAETTEGFCECTEEAADETGRVRMCEECLRPKLHCVCKQSPTCYKCGKNRCEDSEGCPRTQTKYGSEMPRSRTRHRYSESVRTAPNISTHYERTHQTIESHLNEPRHDMYQASRQSPTGKSTGSAAHKTKTCEERCSQSAFQKLKSHFRRCNSCGKKQAKKSNESKEIQCAQDSKVDLKGTNVNGKTYNKIGKPDKQKDASAGPEETRSPSVKRHRHQPSEK